MIEFRDRFTREIGAKLIVHTNHEAIAAGANPFRLGTEKCCSAAQNPGLARRSAGRPGFDAAFGCARRDEEKSCAKERIYSFRDRFGPVGPPRTSGQNSGIYTTGRINKGETIRVFPLSNWTELDVWQYIEMEKNPGSC